ncbi:MAG TPA: hypothetical protein VMV14_11170 [Acidimicrobiales bacterium]|nr:hypothetical protein [Acidimicrobiales bacterium]
MIVRILGDGRFDLPDSDAATLDRLDGVLVETLDGGDSARFSAALGDLIGHVRQTGTRLPDDDFGTSELVVPHEGSSIDEVRALLGDGA